MINKKWVDIELYPSNGKFVMICSKFRLKSKAKSAEECSQKMKQLIKNYFKFNKIKEDSIKVYGLL